MTDYDEQDPDIYGVAWFNDGARVAETGYGFTRTFAAQIAEEGATASDFLAWVDSVPWGTDVLTDAATVTVVRADLETQDGTGDEFGVWRAVQA